MAGDRVERRTPGPVVGGQHAALAVEEGAVDDELRTGPHRGAVVDLHREAREVAPGVVDGVVGGGVLDAVEQPEAPGADDEEFRAGPRRGQRHPARQWAGGDHPPVVGDRVVGGAVALRPTAVDPAVDHDLPAGPGGDGAGPVGERRPAQPAPPVGLRIIGGPLRRPPRSIATPVDDLGARPGGDVPLPAGQRADRPPRPPVGDVVGRPDGLGGPDRRRRLAGPGGVGGGDGRRAGLVEGQAVAGPVGRRPRGEGAADEHRGQQRGHDHRDLLGADVGARHFGPAAPNGLQVDDGWGRQVKLPNHGASILRRRTMSHPGGPGP